ncbi:hypothetical protein WN944_004139 [Citrus x changshan-huyou]|uniref:Major facilitator superfamily (MFS) profile domain-containing protein n=1 Tax=Citrus x changshan-huyou TaxID=2935761 RepID=A0AAP0LZU3_9ROSI
MAAKSQLHSSNPSCFFSSQSNSPNLKRTRLGGAFKTRNLLVKPIKWGSQQSLSFSYKLGRRQQQRGSGRSSVIKCTAEGIERGILIGGGESREAILVGERYKVVALLACVMCLCNADRVVMSVAVVPLAAKFGWSSSFLGIVQSSFLWGYIFSSVIGGALVDKYGGKKVLAWGVALWSLSTLLTPWAATHSTASLLAVRAFFGLAEGVAMPAMSTLTSSLATQSLKMSFSCVGHDKLIFELTENYVDSVSLVRWFPSHERASAIGICMGGFHLGNVVGLLLTPIMLSTIGISGPFILFSSLGLLWLSTWISKVTNDPCDSPFVSKSELRLIQAGKSDSVKKRNPPSLRHLLSKLPSWTVIIANITNNWGYFVLLSWMPIYFNTVFNVNLKQAAWFSAVPWGTMAVSGYMAGKASDSLIRAGYSLTLVRKIMQSIGFIGPGVSLLCLNYAKSPAVAAVLITIALSLSSFSQAGYLLNIQEIAPDCAGFLHGIANSAGTLAAIISTIGTGNVPATFGHPFWSVLCDFKMFGLMLTGKMDREIKRLGKRPVLQVF